MTRWMTAGLMAVASIVGVASAQAQEATPGPGAVVVTLIPGGGTFFVEGKDTNEAKFGNYGLGAAVEVHLTRVLSVEGEVTGALGITQDLRLQNGTASLKTPNLVNYTGNLVVSVPTRSSVVPYVTGGVGGLTLLDTASLSIDDSQTFLTGNVGGGTKWFSSNGRWGLRADYRFITVRSSDDAPAFFGRETRYGHRVYGGLLINAWR